MWIKKSEFVDADRAGSSFKKFSAKACTHLWKLYMATQPSVLRFASQLGLLQYPAVHRHVSSNTEERSVYGRDKQDYRTQQDWMGQSN